MALKDETGPDDRDDARLIVQAGADYYPFKGAKVADMAAGFFADVPDLALECDDVRTAGSHVAYFWTFTGTHATTKNRLRIVGWEEWDLDGELKISASRGWFDADEYGRQTAPR